MRSTHTRLLLPAVLVVLALPAGAGALPPTAAATLAGNPYPYAPHEPRAKAASLAAAAEYLDGVARYWMRPNSCGTCHANFAYLMARPRAGGDPPAVLAETRQFLEARKPPRDFSFDAHAVGIAFALAWDDARTGDVLRPTTRDALRRMWATQRANGTWPRLGCGELLPSENDTPYTAVLAALAAGLAPEGYAHSREAQDGLTRLRRYFALNPPKTLHDTALRLWASLHLDGLMTTPEREAAVRRLLAARGRDGGWSLAAMSGPPATPASLLDERGDGYSTALAVYVLRQAGVSAAHAGVARGAAWLRASQRVSGRWFTPAPVSPTEGGVGSRDLYAQNLGTAFAVLALDACDTADTRPGAPRPYRRPGLSLRDGATPD
jgi:squalene-hopene/tetraprenyl-beta-curcumene cyclase